MEVRPRFSRKLYRSNAGSGHIRINKKAAVSCEEAAAFFCFLLNYPEIAVCLFTTLIVFNVSSSGPWTGKPTRIFSRM